MGFDWDGITSLAKEHSLSISPKPRCPPVLLAGLSGGCNFNQSKEIGHYCPTLLRQKMGRQHLRMWSSQPSLPDSVAVSPSCPPKGCGRSQLPSLAFPDTRMEKSGQIHQWSIIWLRADLGQTGLSSPCAKVLSTLLNVWWSLEVLYNPGFWIMFSFESCLPV